MRRQRPPLRVEIADDPVREGERGVKSERRLRNGRAAGEGGDDGQDETPGLAFEDVGADQPSRAAAGTAAMPAPAAQALRSCLRIAAAIMSGKRSGVQAKAGTPSAASRAASPRS